MVASENVPSAQKTCSIMNAVLILHAVSLFFPESYSHLMVYGCPMLLPLCNFSLSLIGLTESWVDSKKETQYFYRRRN